MTANDRPLQLRVTADVRHTLSVAADLVDEDMSKFVRSAAMERATAVIRRHNETLVPPDYFDEMLARLDEPVQRNAALTEAARRVDSIVKR